MVINSHSPVLNCCAFSNSDFCAHDCYLIKSNECSEDSYIGLGDFLFVFQEKVLKFVHA